jgi:hypothetical protein
MPSVGYPVMTENSYPQPVFPTRCREYCAGIGFLRGFSGEIRVVFMTTILRGPRRLWIMKIMDNKAGITLAVTIVFC